MVFIRHDIIPDGDLELVLRDHSTQYVIPSVWFRCSIKEDVSHDQPDQDRVDLPQVPSPLPSLEVSGDGPIEIRMRVSSHHLTLASPVLKKMTKGPWKETFPPDFQSDSASYDDPKKSEHSKAPVPLVREVTTTGWNAHALVAVMNIIHGRNNDVPREISLEFFVNIAVIVDYYHCEKAVQLAAELWRQLMCKPPTRYGKRAIMWLYIAWVFSWPKLFSEMGRIIWEHGMGLELVEAKDLPVGQFLDILDSRRQQSILKILTEIDNIADDLMHGRNGCNNNCMYMMIGLLVTEQCKMEDLDPPLGFDAEPFTGYSVRDLIKRVESLPAAELWDTDPTWGKHTVHKCSAAIRLRPAIDETLGCIEKLSIAEFQKGGVLEKEKAEGRAGHPGIM